MASKHDLTYKNYTATLEVDTKSGNICGRVAGIRDVITFQGETVAKATERFHQVIDNYLEFCQEVGEEPEKPFSGRLPYRTSSEKHRMIYLAAEQTGKSINSWMDEVLYDAAKKILIN